MADEPLRWGAPPVGGQVAHEGWLRRQPWYIKVPVIGGLWLLIVLLVVTVLVPVFFGGFGADEPATSDPAPVEQRQAPARRDDPEPYNGPRPCATVWPTTCNDGGK